MMKKLLAILLACVMIVSCNRVDENAMSDLDFSNSSVTDENGAINTDESLDGNPNASSQTDETTDTDNDSSTNSGSNNNDSDNNQTSNSTSKPTTSESSQSTTQTPNNTQKQAFSVTAKVGSSWEEGGYKVVQYDVVIKNTSGKAISGWQVEFDVPKDTQVFGGWNGKFSAKDGKLTVKNESYNGDIAANGETSFGIQLKSKSTITLKVGSGGASGNVVDNNSNQNNNNNDNNNNNNNNDKPPVAIPPSQYTPANKTAKQGDDWLSVKGNQIIDKNGKEVWLTGVNWFGYNTGTNTFDGLWSSNLENSLQTIADRGFNLLRVPMSVELVKNWRNGTYPKANYNTSLNPKLNNKNSLQIFDYVVDVCQNVGLKIMIDMHSAETHSMGHMYNVWYKGSITTEDFYQSLEFLGDRYKGNDTIIAYDLKNEPHGKPNENPRAKWDNSKDADNWKYVAETASKRLLAKNPNVLVMVEGIEIYPKNTATNGNFKSTNSGDYYFNWWGGNLRGVKKNPIDLGKYQNKLVYSPHDYGPKVYKQPWFYSGFSYNSLINDVWRDNWLYIHTDKIAPLLIGEWGGFMNDKDNLTWMTHMRTLIKNYRLHHTFWCYNENSSDTGGLVTSDWKTWDEKKYNFVKEVLWQDGGQFVGLDHEIPLGKNGKTL